MGYIRHHAIAVTAISKENINEAYKNAIEIFGKELVTEIKTSVINKYYSFFVAPDGSKEGWEESDKYDKKRKEFIEWIKKVNKKYNICLSYCEFYYGDDNGESKIVNHN